MLGTEDATRTTEAEGGEPASAGPVVRSQPAATGRSTGRVILIVFTSLALLYAVTARWSAPYGGDEWTNAITGWSLAEEGTFVAEGMAPIVETGRPGFIGWFVDGVDGPVSQYPPGAALTVAPAYALADAVVGIDATSVTLVDPRFPTVGSVTLDVPPMWPATLSSVVVTALACAVVAATVLSAGASPRDAVLVGLVAGVATSAWGVASNSSWTHGPTMLAVSLAGLAAARGRWWLCGLAYGAGVLVRPHVALIAAVLGLWLLVRRRHIAPVAAIGAGSSLGLALVLLYNQRMFGAPSISGGYSGDFAERALTGDPLWFVANVARGLVAIDYGLLLWAPFLLVLAPAAWRHRHRLPDWSVGAALGGTAYLLLQWRANRASGGEGFFPYRYPLAMLFACAPALGLTALHWWDTTTGVRRRLLPYSLVIAVIGQVFGAIAF